MIAIFFVGFCLGAVLGFIACLVLVGWGMAEDMRHWGGLH